MYIINENTFDIPLEDLRKISILAQDEIFKYVPKWNSFNCKNIFNADFSKPIVEIKNLQNVFTSQEVLSCTNLDKLKIQIGFFNQSEYTSFKCLIKISLSDYIFHKIKDLNLDSKIGFSEMSKLINVSHEELKKRVSLERFFQSLSHELTHFLDDSLHNNQIYSKIKKSAKDISLSTAYNSKDINLSYMEINAQINAIKNLKAIYYKQWDTLSIFDMIKKDSSLVGLYRHFSDEFGKQQAVDWVKKLIKRMSRENLLGKRMQSMPSNDAILIVETFSGMNCELKESCNINKYITI